MSEFNRNHATTTATAPEGEQREEEEEEVNVNSSGATGNDEALPTLTTTTATATATTTTTTTTTTSVPITDHLTNLEAALESRFIVPASTSSTYTHGTFSSRSNLIPGSGRRPKDAFFVCPPKRMNVELMSSDDDRTPTKRKLERVLNIINHVCIAFVTICLTWMCWRVGLAGTALHAWLVTIGFSFLMAEAVMSHYSGNVLTAPYKRPTKTLIHWILQVMGGACGLLGTLIKLLQKGFLLHSIHGKLGFAAFILCLVSMLSGLSSLYAIRVKNMLSPLLNKTLHNFLGVTAFIVAMFAQFYGYETGFFARKSNYEFRLWMKAITMISLALTCIGPLQALYHRTNNILRNLK